MEEDIDINILVQSYSQKISSLTNELILKDALIKQLSQKVILLENKLEKGE